MIAHKSRESRRVKHSKMARNMERLFKENKCRDCSVIVTRMDFAKILGKFTKVKIQYESSTSPKSSKTATTSSSKSNAKLKNNENGIIQNHRKSNNKHQINSHNQKKHKNEVVPPLQKTNNVLKENNVLKKTATSKNLNIKVRGPYQKQYAIIFNEPKNNFDNDSKSELRLADLLPTVDKSILPSEDWYVNYFPNKDELKEDKVYDRIAAELEDLMCNDKPHEKIDKTIDDKGVDEFPSIMDILNDNISVNSGEPKDHSSALDYKSSLDSSDVEAMLLGKTNVAEQSKEAELCSAVEPMEIDHSDVNKLINDVVESNTVTENTTNEETKQLTAKEEAMDIDNPHSPSILDEALQKGIEEHLPNIAPADAAPEENNIAPVEAIPKEMQDKNGNHVLKSPTENRELNNTSDMNTEPVHIKENGLPQINVEEITHVTFKKLLNGRCCRMVTCPKNMKYSIEIENKSVELLGAPKYISSLDDLQVLLQIVNESDLESLHVLY